MTDIPQDAIDDAVDAWHEAPVNEHGVIPLDDLMRCVLEGAYPVLAAQIRREYEDLLGSIWLYIGWRYVTKQLTTPQKEMFADAVEAWSRRLNDDDPDEPTDVDRWWRPDAPTRQIGEARG